MSESRLLPLSRIDCTTEAIEIDHGDRDISAAYRNGVIEVGIGENYRGAEGYERWTEISLTMDEARAFYDWLSKKIAP